MVVQGEVAKLSFSLRSESEEAREGQFETNRGKSEKILVAHSA